MVDHFKQMKHAKIWFFLVFLIGIALGGYSGYQLDWGIYQISWENLSTFYPLLTGFGGALTFISLLYLIFGPRSRLKSRQKLPSTDSVVEKSSTSLNSVQKAENKVSNTPPITNKPSSISNNPAPSYQASNPPQKPVSASTSIRGSTPNTEPIRTHTVQPALKSSSNHIPPSKSESIDFLEKVIKLGDLAKQSHELIENEADLSKKEKTRLLLKRDEFKKLYSNVKEAQFDSF